MIRSLNFGFNINNFDKKVLHVQIVSSLYWQILWKSTTWFKY